jgi:hypothetical protein
MQKYPLMTLHNYYLHRLLIVEFNLVGTRVFF